MTGKKDEGVCFSKECVINRGNARSHAQGQSFHQPLLTQQVGLAPRPTDLLAQ